MGKGMQYVQRMNKDEGEERAVVWVTKKEEGMRVR
jgi:hypothetical protein